MKLEGVRILISLFDAVGSVDMLALSLDRENGSHSGVSSLSKDLKSSSLRYQGSSSLVLLENHFCAGSEYRTSRPWYLYHGVLPDDDAPVGGLSGLCLKDVVSAPR